MGSDDAIIEDGAAVALGRLAQRIDGADSAEAHVAGRERMLSALEAERRPRRRWLVPTGAFAVAALAAGVCVFLLRPARIEYRVSGPALTTNGQWLGVAEDRGASLLNFSEGTQIELGPGSLSRVAELTPNGARVVLGSGGLRARVKHLPHARWSVGAGPYSIDVTGTAFDVEWSKHDDTLEVRLHDGSVIVRGPALHEGIRVVAGQRLIAHPQTGKAELAPLAPPTVASEPPPASVRAPAATPAHLAPSWSDLLTSGNFRGVLALAQARGIDQSLRRGSLADLVALSDAARYAGDLGLSRRGLLMQRTRFAKSAEAHAAAFVLGRMADDEGAQDEALRWYEGYLRESPHGAFAAEALGRKLVVIVRAGDVEAARAVAKSYLQRFPRGAHAAYARELLARP